MKKKRIFGYVLIIFLLTISSHVSAQKITTASISQDGDVSFKVIKQTFDALLSKKGRILGYVVNAKGSIAYDFDGRIEKVGTIKISRDFEDRINKIDSEKIVYDFDGRVSQIGETKITYNSNNNVDNIGGQRITYFHDGKVDKISSATISYNLDGKVDNISDYQGIVFFEFIKVN